MTPRKPGGFKFKSLTIKAPGKKLKREIIRRVKEMKSGKVKSVSWEEVKRGWCRRQPGKGRSK